jgi:hypothetical protein
MLTSICGGWASLTQTKCYTKLLDFVQYLILQGGVYRSTRHSRISMVLLQRATEFCQKTLNYYRLFLLKGVLTLSPPSSNYYMSPQSLSVRNLPCPSSPIPSVFFLHSPAERGEVLSMGR